ncbi:hypothetical protein BV25DRAFT_1821437 [Artomyces pyxidatus]|uniref:Uncharacterized protein n=1 Tax=Artomyces pyxidatus TaxID=48021 RepID=A0ACB8TBF8_9AGAM|nr:hypothetical protein BV25DRAFT_1821437 [Artomyces pyxidatus]
MFPRHAKSVSSILPNAPKLRDLSIGKIGVSWPLHLLNPDIVHLTIDEIGIRDRPSLPQLREALQAMPKLETLALTYSLPVQPAHATIYTVSENCDVSLLPTLPSVTSLKLAATSGIDILAFNTNFYFPSVTSLEIASSLDLDPGHTSLQSILASLCSFYQPVLSSQRQGQKPFYFRSLSIEYNEDSDGWDIRAGGPTTNTTNERYPSWMRTQFEPRFTTKLQTSRRADIEGFCKAMCQLLPMEHVSTLVVDCDLFRQRDDWLQAFCRMTNIATLMVRGAAVHGLVDALDDEVGANVRIQTSAYIADVMALVHGELGATVPAHIFPRMEHLAIGRVSFDAVADDPQTLYEHLRSGLERRHQEGTGVQPLARLAVHDCNIQVEHVTQLGEAVTHGALDWDGRWAGLLELLGADFTTTEGSDA